MVFVVYPSASHDIDGKNYNPLESYLFDQMQEITKRRTTNSGLLRKFPVKPPAAVQSTMDDFLRSFEGNGKKILAKTAKTRGCDPAAAQEMRPEYVKSILAPLGMLQHPVIVVSDHEKGSKPVLARLLRDPDIGPMVQEVPTEARWFGGDMTLAVMVSVHK